MSAVDTILKMFTKETKDPDAPKPPVGSRSEREAKIKDKAGMVISIFALLLAVNAWYGGKLSSTVLNNTLGANNTWAQYQAKAGRGVSYEIAAKTTADPKIKAQFMAEKERMDTEKKEIAVINSISISHCCAISKYPCSQHGYVLGQFCSSRIWVTFKS